jgi:phosphohistidine phosphatase
MDLFILRHGQAGQKSTSSKDFDRSLTVEGQQEIVKISNALNSFEIEFDHIYTSPLVRAKQTAEIVSESLKFRGNIQEVVALKPECNKAELYTMLSKLKQDSMSIIVGHQPYLSELICEAISQSSCRINLKKGGLARLKIISTIPKIKGELRWLLTPKLLKKMI